MAQRLANGTYPVSADVKQRLERDYTYHPPKEGQQARYEYIRMQAKKLAYTIVGLTPPSREQSVALTLLEQAVMEANAAISRNE